MKPATKALLLSALVFPGLGQLSVQRTRSGLVLLVPAATSLLYVLVGVVGKAMDLADRIARGELPLDMAQLQACLQLDLASGELRFVNLAVWVFLLCWLAGVVHAILMGRRQGAARDRVAQ